MYFLSYTFLTFHSLFCKHSDNADYLNFNEVKMVEENNFQSHVHMLA